MITVVDAADLKPILAANVRRLREDRGWNQTVLAERIGISRVALNRIEKARMSPSSEVLFSIADAFGVTADSLRQLSEKISAA